MANPQFNDPNKMIDYIQKQMNQVLQNEVAEAVKKQMHQVIEDITYQQYTPLEYVRTHELSSESNMEVTVINENTIRIVNTRHDGDVNVAEVVATGVGYSWTESPIAKAQLARNFYEDTINFLKHYGTHLSAFRKGMARRGFDVK